MARSAELNARPSSLPAALDAWRDWLTSEKRCAAHTLESYNRDIGDFLAFLDEHLDAATDLTALAALRQSDARHRAILSHPCNNPPMSILEGPLKLAAAQKLAEARGVKLADCAFYSDHVADLPLLEAVGRPFAVGPHAPLAAIARARGWTVVPHG